MSWRSRTKAVVRTKSNLAAAVYIYIYVAWTFMYSLAISFVLNTNTYICLLFFVLLKV